MIPGISAHLPRIFFATSNMIKLQEVRAIVPSITARHVDFLEIQSLDTVEVVRNKLSQIQMQTESEAYMVEDTGLAIAAWKKLPGAMIKWFVDELGPAGLADLACCGGANTEAVATSTVGVCFQGASKVWSGTLCGRIVAPRGRLGGWTPIFEIEGTGRTLAEMDFKERLSVTMRGRPLEQAIEWITARNRTSEEICSSTIRDGSRCGRL